MIYKNILLFPGGFKPFHDGHLSILESHISNIDKIHINKVYIIISPKNREYITADSTLWFLTQIKNQLVDIYNINLEINISDMPSPITKCYNIVNHGEFGEKYCLVTSNKDTDLKRKDEFVKNYLYTGKYYDLLKGEQSIYINADIEPIYYKNRTDNKNNIPISSMIIRNDIINNDYINFRSAYDYMLSNHIVSENLLKIYFKKIYNLYYFFKDK
jgi:hypothetical protein